MIKIVRGKYIKMDKRAYDSIIEEKGTYILEISTCEKQLTDEEKIRLFDLLRGGKSKNMICKEFEITEYTFAQICKERFGTLRINEIRDKLKEDAIKLSISQEK